MPGVDSPFFYPSARWELPRCKPGDLVTRVKADRDYDYATGKVTYRHPRPLAIVVSVFEDSENDVQLLGLLCSDGQYVTSYNEDLEVV